MSIFPLGMMMKTKVHVVLKMEIPLEFGQLVGLLLVVSNDECIDENQNELDDASIDEQSSLKISP
jgi:hypothetical protein